MNRVCGLLGITKPVVQVTKEDVLNTGADDLILLTGANGYGC